MKKTLKTSSEWMKDFPKIQIMNPDGWDRSHFQYSWNREKISKIEFEKRMSLSTIIKLK